MAIINSKDAGTLVAEMIMLRAGGGSHFVLMEGPEDLIFWRNHLRIEPVSLIVAEGVSNLQGCMRSLPSQLTGSVCAIADKDFREFLESDCFSGCQDTFFYDEGFLETFLMNSRALSKVLSIHGDPILIEQFIRKNKCPTIFSEVRRMGAFFGRLRILNQRNSWGLCFSKKFTPYRYIDESSWRLNEQQLLADVTGAVGWTEMQIKAQFELIEFRGALGLVHGHDAIKIVAIGLRKCLGSVNIGPQRLHLDLCLAFEKEALTYKKLTKKLRGWRKARPVL